MSAETKQTEATTDSTNMDPFANQRDGTNDPFAEKQGDLQNVAGSEDMAMGNASTDTRRMSKEWDASKVPPSQFQKRKGSILSTPSSRDSHQHGGGERDKAYFEKLKEKGWDVLKGGSK